ncbi:MAG TPA: addiction module antidote protein [Candidatus Kapabacteria bacterium]|nr:addiction module antidote protein [Candidatus Kapabacteria bacterium]
MPAKKTKQRITSESYEAQLLEDLKDPKEAFAYLKVSFEDEDPRMFLTALRRVAQANGGLSALAKETGLNRENLYRTLSPKGNPKLGNIDAVLRSFGMKLSVEQVPRTRRKAA